MLPLVRIVNGSWIGHAVEQLRDLFGVPNVEEGTRLRACGLSHISLIEGLDCGLTRLISKSKSFEPLSGLVAADSVNSSEFGKAEIFIHVPPLRDGPYSICLQNRP